MGENLDRAELKKAWLRQLQKECRDILWRRDFKIPPLTLEFMADRKLWGQCRAEQRRILLNENLIEHGWPAVLGILGHELCHQLVFDFHRERFLREDAHGPAFQFMASALNLDPFYQSPKVELKESRPQPPAFQEAGDPAAEKVLDKVRKLLALGGSQVAAESELAMAKAFQLMARHNLKTVRAEKKEGLMRLSLPLGGRAVESRHSLMAHILSAYFFVEVIFVSGYNSYKNHEEKFLEIFGRSENVKLAEHVFKFLDERSESLWRERRKALLKSGQKRSGHSARFAFKLGLLEGFLETLKKADGGAEKNASALVLSKDAELKSFIGKCHPKIKSIRRGTGIADHHSHEEGKSAGRDLKFNRPIENREKGGGQITFMPKIAG